MLSDIDDLDGDGDTSEKLPVDLAWSERFVDDISVDDTGAGTKPIIDIGAYERNEFCGDSEHPYPVSDVNRDCRVGVADLAIMASEKHRARPPIHHHDLIT